MMEIILMTMDARQIVYTPIVLEILLALSLRVDRGRVRANNLEIKDPAKPLIIRATVVLPPAIGTEGATAAAPIMKVQDPILQIQDLVQTPAESLSAGMVS